MKWLGTTMCCAVMSAGVIVCMTFVAGPERLSTARAEAIRGGYADGCEEQCVESKYFKIAGYDHSLRYYEDPTAIVVYSDRGGGTRTKEDVKVSMWYGYYSSILCPDAGQAGEDIVLANVWGLTGQEHEVDRYECANE